MTSYFTTNIYTDQIGQANATVDLGALLVDVSNTQLIFGNKTFTSLPVSSAVPTQSNQFANQTYAYNTAISKATTITIPGTSAYGTNSYIYNGTMLPNSRQNNLSNVLNTPYTSITVPNKVSLTQSNVLVSSDYPSNFDQFLTFGTGSVLGGYGRKTGIWVAGGYGTFHTMAFSYDGINWTGMGMNIFTTFCNAVAYNGYIWVAMGAGKNSLAYSYDGLSWIGLGTGLFINNSGWQPFGNFAWNGIIWAGVSNATITAGNNVFISSYDGINWIGNGLGGVGMTGGNINNIATNGTMFVACGSNTSQTGYFYSYNGINWYVAAVSIVTPNTQGVVWGGTFWLATANNAPYYYTSTNGVYWTGTALTVSSIQFSYSVGWNGYMFVGCFGLGSSANNLVYTYDAVTWYYMGNLFFNSGFFNVAWNGYMWVGVGYGNTPYNHCLAYSYNGIQWFPYIINLFSSYGLGVAYGIRRENILYLPATRTLALGAGTGGTIAYSYSGTKNNSYDYNVNNYWTPGITNAGASTNTLFSYANAAAWNGYQWIAVGAPVTGTTTGNTFAYSSIYSRLNGNVNLTSINYTPLNSYTNPSSTPLGNAGNIWTGMGNYIFSTSGNGIGWNGNVWVACGQGGNSLAYSPNGFTWFGLGTSIFSTSGQSVAWNGNVWIATGAGTVNTMAYSKDGVIWTGLGNSIFNVQANGLAWNGILWVVTGQGNNTMAFSWDSVTWTGLGVTNLTVTGNTVATNTTRTMWVAGGQGTNNLLYSQDGISWTAVVSQPFTTKCCSVIWNGKFFVAAGEGTNTLAYSSDGVIWTGEGVTNLTTKGIGMAANMGVGSAIIPVNYVATTSTPLWVLGGFGVSTLSYSQDNVTWTGLATGIFSTQCTGIGYSPSGVWVATGFGTNNTLAYSTTGTVWIGLGKNLFSTSGQSAIWNGIMWVASGNGNGVSLAYSYTGNTWLPAPNNVFSGGGYAANWNGIMWIAVGNGTGNTMAFSYDGINWTGMGKNTFTTQGTSVAWNGTIWVATGSGGNTLASSINGIYWIGFNQFIFTTSGFGVTWNGKIWVAVGSGGNVIAWSNSGMISNSWNGLRPSTVGAGYLTTGSAVTWSGQLWMATGTGTQSSTVFSYNGNIWYPQNNSVVTGVSTGYAIAYSNYFTNKMVLDNAGMTGTQTIDIIPDLYYQSSLNQINYQFTFTNQ